MAFFKCGSNGCKAIYKDHTTSTTYNCKAVYSVLEGATGIGGEFPIPNEYEKAIVFGAYMNNNYGATKTYTKAQINATSSSSQLTVYTNGNQSLKIYKNGNNIKLSTTYCIGLIMFI